MIKSQHAFTLIEALITLSIITILIVISLPMLQDFLHHTNDEILQEQLLRAIDLAKFEAHARGIPLVFCASKDNKTCGDDWADDQIVFMNENEDGIVKNREQILAVIQAQPLHGSVHWRSFPRYRHYVLFSPTGLTYSDNGTFWHCHAQSPMWAIVINKSGRTRVVYPDRNGAINDSHGQPLPCDDAHQHVFTRPVPVTPFSPAEVNVNVLHR